MVTLGRQSSHRLAKIVVQVNFLYLSQPNELFLQTKHHWWWKANHIFHNLVVARHFIGTVVFLEEDHFVAEDFLHTLSMMQQEQENNYKEVCST